MGLLQSLRRGLVPRLVGTYLVFALMGTACMGLAAYWAGRVMLRQAVVARLETASRQKEVDLNLWVEERQNNLDFVSKVLADEMGFAGMEGHGYDHLERILEYLRSSQGMQELLILSPAGGRVLASTEPSHRGGYRAIYNYYTQGRERATMQSLYLSPESLKPVLTLSVPIISPRGHLLAVLAMHTGLEPINKIVRSRAGMGETGETYLVDAYNVMVASDQVGDATIRRHAHNMGVLRALAGGTGYELYTNDAGVPVVGVYRWLPVYQMALVAEMSQAEAFAPAGRLALIIVLVGLATVGVLAVGVLVVSRRVARPVLEVTRAAMAVADGDLSARAPVLTNDELGKLAVAFNTMTGELSTLYERLEQEGADRWAILQGSFDGIAMADDGGGIEYLNPGMENLFGYALHETPSLASLAEHIFPVEEERQCFVSNLIADMREAAPPERLYRFLHRDGTTRWCRFRVAPMHGGRVVINAQDITDIKNSEEQVRHMALHDSLTGLPNRQLFADRLDQAIRRAKRQGGHVSLLYVDLDKFKGLNDTYGHAHGDRVLVETAGRLRSCVRESDTVARLGGDEFVVILADQQHPADALPVARKILECLYQPEVEGGSMFLGASVGLACYPMHGVDQDSLLNAADAAMYMAKRAGGNNMSLAEGFPQN